MRSVARLFGCRVVVTVGSLPEAELLADDPASDELSHGNSEWVPFLLVQPRGAATASSRQEVLERVPTLRS